jgi:hypothetical protein
MLEMSEITKLNDYVINSKFTYPNQESIASMHIGEGEKEVIQAIID